MVINITVDIFVKLQIFVYAIFSYLSWHFPGIRYKFFSSMKLHIALAIFSSLSLFKKLSITEFTSPFSIMSNLFIISVFMRIKFHSFKIVFISTLHYFITQICIVYHRDKFFISTIVHECKKIIYIYVVRTQMKSDEYKFNIPM